MGCLLTSISFRKISFLILISLITVSLFSCAVNYIPPSEVKVDKSKVIDQKFDDVWNKLIKWFAERGIKIETIEKASGLIQVNTTINELKLNEYPIADCGLVNEYRVDYNRYLKLNVVVTKLGIEQSKVDINLFLENWAESENSFHSYKVNPPKMIPISCYSTGYLESSIMSYLADKKSDYQPVNALANTAGTGNTNTNNNTQRSAYQRTNSIEIGTKPFWYLGIGSMAMNSFDFKDVDVSDWQNYGTGSSEGRVYLPLSSAAAGSVPISVTFGGGACLNDGKDKLLVEFMFSMGSTSLYAGGLGVGYDLGISNGEKFRLGFMPKINYLYQAVSFGSVEVMPGKTPPVITPIGTFYTGDKISASHSGVGLQGFLTSKYQITNSFAMGLNLGYSYSYFADLKVVVDRYNSSSSSSGTTKSNSIDVNFSNPAVVEHKAGSTTNPGITPKADCTGLNMLLNFEFAW